MRAGWLVEKSGGNVIGRGLVESWLCTVYDCFSAIGQRQTKAKPKQACPASSSQSQAGRSERPKSAVPQLYHARHAQAQARSGTSHQESTSSDLRWPKPPRTTHVVDGSPSRRLVGKAEATGGRVLTARAWMDLAPVTDHSSLTHQQPCHRHGVAGTGQPPTPVPHFSHGLASTPITRARQGRSRVTAGGAAAPPQAPASASDVSPRTFGRVDSPSFFSEEEEMTCRAFSIRRRARGPSGGLESRGGRARTRGKRKE